MLPYQYVIEVDNGRIIRAYDREEMSNCDHILKLSQYNWDVVEKALRAMCAIDFHDFIEMVCTLNRETDEYKICEKIISEEMKKYKEKYNLLKAFLTHVN